jgi:hypothetical protein
MEKLNERPASASKGNESAPASSANPLRWLRRTVALVWLTWLLSVALLWSQDALGIVHPQALLFVGLLAMTFGAALVGLGCGLWRVLRGPRRARAVAWMAAVVCAVVIIMQAPWGDGCWGRKQIPAYHAHGLHGFFRPTEGMLPLEASCGSIPSDTLTR